MRCIPFLLESGVMDEEANFGFTEICVVLLLSAAMVLILKNFGFCGAPILAALIGVAFMSYASLGFSKISDTFATFESYADISVYTSAVLKAIGIGYIGGISADICNQMGEREIAKCISIGAKFELIFLSLPFIEKMFLAAVELMEI